MCPSLIMASNSQLAKVSAEYSILTSGIMPEEEDGDQHSTLTRSGLSRQISARVILPRSTSPPMSLEASLRTFELTPLNVLNVFSSEDKKISVIPVLLILGSLSDNSAITDFLRNMLQSTDHQPSITSFDEKIFVASSLKSSTHTNYPITAEVNHKISMYYLFSSGLQCYMRMTGFQAIRPNPGTQSNCDSSEVLNNEMDRLCDQFIENKMGTGARDEKFFALERNLAAGDMALTLIWQLTLDRRALFLESFRTHFYNCHVWLFVDLCLDTSQLHSPPSNYGMKWRSQLHYLLRSSCLSQSCHEERKKVCRLFALHTGSMPVRKLESKLQKVKEEAENAAAQYGLKELFDFEIVPINTEDLQHHENDTAYTILMQYLQQLKPQTIPLSWTFLRSALCHQRSIFMERSEICKLAEDCNVEINAFLRFYTSFGSVFDLALINRNSTLVIVDPALFLKKMGDILPPKLSSSAALKFGLFSKSTARNHLGEQHSKYFDAFVSAGLVSKVETRKIRGELPDDLQIADDEKYLYYMSFVREGDIDYESLPGRTIQLVIGLKSPSMTMQAAFTNQLLQLVPSLRFVPRTEQNVTEFVIEGEGAVKVLFVLKGDVIEIRFSYNDDQTCSKNIKILIKNIVTACANIAYLRSKRGGDYKYHFRVMCAGQQEKFHIFPIQEVCTHCNEFLYSQFQAVLENMPIESKFVLVEDLTPEDAIMLADKLKPEDISVFANLVSIPTPFNDKELVSWQFVRMILNLKDKGYTKRQLARTMFQAARSNDSVINSEQQKRFEEVSKHLDIEFYSSEVRSC